MKYPWIDVAKKIQAIAQSGLAYTTNEYDHERYEMLREISTQIVSDFSETDMEKAKALFAFEKGYQTPKVEVRALVFKDGKILMVREKADGKWSVPGGWADIGLSPFDIAKKEVFEEAGIIVKPVKVIGVLDKSKYEYAPSPYHIYSIHVLCEYIDGNPKAGLETYEANFFEKGTYNELSPERVVKENLDMAFEYLEDSQKQAYCD